MTEAVPQPPALDPNERRVVIATNAQWGNIMQCIDLARRNVALAEVPTIMELAVLIATAKPVEPKPNGDGNRHQRRAKAAK